MSSLTFSKMLNTQERKKSPFLVKGVHIRTCPFFSGGRGALLRSKGRLRNIWYTPLFMEHKTKHKTAITQSRFRSLFLSSYSSLLFFFLLIVLFNLHTEKYYKVFMSLLRQLQPRHRHLRRRRLQSPHLRPSPSCRWHRRCRPLSPLRQLPLACPMSTR